MEIKFKFVYSNGKNFKWKVFDLVEIMNGDPFELFSDMPMYRDYKMVGEYQFTGMKDKDQNDIYLDDWFNISGRIYRVIYQDANFRIADDKSNKSLSAGCVNLKGFVIGSVYEYPYSELLESK